MMRASAVDLFCGAGGLAHGFIREGFPVNAGIDVDPACRYPFEFNNRARFIEKDIREMTGRELKSLYPSGHTKVLVGCAPCQPFSTYTNGQDSRQDAKWSLLNEFARLAKETRPEIITMENVLNLQRHEIFRAFKQALIDAGYQVSAFEVSCEMYGIPQRRKRLVLFASVFGEIELVPPTHKPGKGLSIRRAIGKLPPIKSGEQSPTDPLHKASRLSNLNLDRIKASRPGGTWRDWDGALVAECHKRASGETYPSVYGRMEWDAVGPTITTQFYGFGNGRFGHPDQNRGISLREGALLQTFPKHYRFVRPGDPVEMKVVGRLIGNAVPVRLGRVVARSIAKHLEGQDDN